MRPYLTVLKDSFHEAFASRVLWILLAVSTLVLLALAPLGLQDQRATLLRRSSVICGARAAAVGTPTRVGTQMCGAMAFCCMACENRFRGSSHICSNKV